MTPVVFDGLELFSSGPHRIEIGTLGRRWLAPFAASNEDTSTLDLGPREVRLTQRGRLVAPDAAALHALLAPIRAAAEAARTGPLVDTDGVIWPGMTMLEIEPVGPLDRGRLVTLAYVVRYVRIGP